MVETDRNWYLRFTLIGLCFYLSLTTMWSIQGITGWPTGEKLPEEFRVIWAEVREPSKVTDDPGAIYLWCYVVDDETEVNYLDLLRDRNVLFELIKEGLFVDLTPDYDKQPRAYKVRYTKENHKKAIKMLQGLKKGQSIMGKRNDKRSPFFGGPGDDPKSSDFFSETVIPKNQRPPKN